MTWDVLFLLPLVWVGPVLSAVLVAVSLVVAGGLMMHRIAIGVRPRTSWWVWGSAVLSLALLLFAFMANHGEVRRDGMHGGFPWPAYALGFVLGWGAFIRAFLPGDRGNSFRPRPRRPLVETQF